MDLDNPVIKLCIEGTHAEYDGRYEEAFTLENVPIGHAALTIEITEGVESAVPVAVVPFASQSAPVNISTSSMPIWLVVVILK